MIEPQKTIPLENNRPALYSDIVDLIYHGKDGKLFEHFNFEHITVEINGEYYQASLAITKEDDILDADHLVIKPIL